MLTATIIDHAGTTDAVFTNNSTTCSYPIGLATYKEFDSNIDNQALYDAAVAVIQPGTTVTLTVDNPPCAYQGDAFYGDLIYSFAGGVRYGTRLLTDTEGNVGIYCTLHCPTPVPPTAIPSSTPTRTNTPKPSATSTPGEVCPPGTPTRVPTPRFTPTGGCSAVSVRRPGR